MADNVKLNPHSQQEPLGSSHVEVEKGVVTGSDIYITVLDIPI